MTKMIEFATIGGHFSPLGGDVHIKYGHKFFYARLDKDGLTLSVDDKEITLSYNEFENFVSAEVERDIWLETNAH